MRKAIKEFKELVGKTIEGIFEDGWMVAWNCQVLTFTDGTYAAIRSGSNYDGDRESPELTEIDIGNEHHAAALVEWGIMNEEEQGAFLSRMKAQRAMMSAQKEGEERATYERLRAKYAVRR